MKNYLSLLLLIILSFNINAQGPSGFNYQATVRNASGDLIVNQNVYFKFNILQGSQTAVSSYTETRDVLTDDLGQVSLVIGQGSSSSGIFSDLDWSLGNYFLDIELNTGSGYVAMGTTQFYSVPYALYAETAKSATETQTLASVVAIGNTANSQLKNLIDPTDNQDAATKAYVDALENKLAVLETRSEPHAPKVTRTSLSDGDIIEVSDFPYHIKNGISMSFYADVTLNGSITYGKGFNKYLGDYFTIDAINIYHYYNSALKTTKPHGLSISKFIFSSFSVDDNSRAHFILKSLGGTFQTTFNLNYEMNFAPFIKTDGQDISNVKLTCTSRQFQHPVWAFGDSYFGVGRARWPGTMKNFGYFNFLLNGLAGQGSAGAYNDLERSLKYGTPKYIVWCLGMNDSDVNWQKHFEKLKQLCNLKGIELILSTIPTVPALDKEVISGDVIASGYRYIDFYKAVGADNEGNWYSGYLSSDGVHPTQAGAEALATQVLIDFPELMQQGKTF
jgi:hypothetical protein